jgi:predicted Zn-dependent protease
MKRIIIFTVTLLFPVLFFSQSLKLDQLLGEENAKMVEAQMGIYSDAEKTEYLRKVGNRLVAQLEEPLFEYQFHLVPDMAPNAFALPGGYLYVTTGLLPILENEDELACILGHEIIHSNNRHSVQQLKKSILPRLLEVPGNLIGVLNEDLGALFNAPIQTSNALLLASYSRKYETEADNIGIELAAKAGYDPSAMITSLTRMSTAIEVATGNEEQKSYFNDHPYTPDRTEAIDELIAELDWEQKAPVSNDFLLEFDSVLFGESPGVGVVRKNQFLHPDLDFTITFPKHWDIDNQPSNVGAYHPDRQAAAFVSLEEAGITPEQAGKRFIEDMDSEYESKMTDASTHNFNGKEGYLISFVDETTTVPMYAYVLWIPMDGKLFKLMGIAPLAYKPNLEKTAESLRPLNAEEKSSFTIDLLRVVKAKQNETIAGLSRRVGNVLNEELTAIINDKKENEKLDKGELLKVVLTYPYQIKTTN